MLVSTEETSVLSAELPGVSVGSAGLEVVVSGCVVVSVESIILSGTNSSGIGSPLLSSRVIIWSFNSSVAACNSAKAASNSAIAASNSEVVSSNSAIVNTRSAVSLVEVSSAVSVSLEASYKRRPFPESADVVSVELV